MRLAAALLVALVAAAPARAAAADVDVSGLPGAQSEAAIAVGPGDGSVLLAGSNSFSEGTMRAYSSTDGGASWTPSTVFPPPKTAEASCAADPGVAIDLRGRQYYSFVRSSPCRTGHPRLYVASRAGPDAPWGAPVLVAPLRGARFDDKPAIAVDRSRSSPHANRVYAAWTRVSHDGAFSILVSSSDDGGRTWSPPAKANRTGEQLSYVTLATSRRGTLYVAWHDISAFHVNVAMSTDGGRTFGGEHQVVAFAIVTIPACAAGIVIPAQKRTCVQPNPILSVDTSRGRYAGRVYVTYTLTDFQGDKGIAVTVFDARLRPLAGYARDRKPLLLAPAPPSANADQFWPASAVDPFDGTLWACFYDTRGDPKRTSAFFSCTFSEDGGRTWARPVHAATVASDETGPGADPREYGDYEGLAAAGGKAHPVWTDSRELATKAEEIFTATLTKADFR
ncbi:MAG TPA: sialidase family protein [Gaiellaceae bacterium]|nr:sialidase family protein [Gaiellaceae bacterium]